MTVHQSSSSFADAASQIAAKLTESVTTRDAVRQALLAEVDLLRLSGLLTLLVPAEGGGLAVAGRMRWK
jgi:hypothetical protein